MKSIRKWLREFLSKILSESLSKIVSDAILLFLPLGALFLFLKEKTIQALLILKSIAQTEFPLYVLLIIYVVIFLTLYLYKKNYRPKYFFFDYENVRWRANEKTGEVEQEPYCPKHNVQLVCQNGYYCPIDGERKGFPYEDTVKIVFAAATSIAKSLVDNQIESTTIKKIKS